MHLKTVLGIAVSLLAISVSTAQDDIPAPLAQVLRLQLSPGVLATEWSPDSTLLAVSSGDVVSIWDVATGQELNTFEGDTYYVTSLAWSPDGEKLAALGNWLVVWNVNTRRNLNILEYPENETNVGTVDWSPDSERLAFIRWNYDPETPFASITQIWNQSTRDVTNIGHPLTSSEIAARWSPDGRMLAIADYDALNIWDVDSGQLLTEFIDVSDVEDVAWSPDSTMIAAGVSKGVDLSRGSTDGYNYSRVIQIRDIQTGDVLAEMDGHIDPVLSIDWSPDGTMIASGGADNTVRIWDVEAEQIAALIEEYTDSVNSVAWSPDGTMLASGSDDGTAVVWDVSNWK